MRLPIPPPGQGAGENAGRGRRAKSGEIYAGGRELSIDSKRVPCIPEAAGDHVRRDLLTGQAARPRNRLVREILASDGSLAALTAHVASRLTHCIELHVQQDEP